MLCAKVHCQDYHNYFWRDFVSYKRVNSQLIRWCSDYANSYTCTLNDIALTNRIAFDSRRQCFCVAYKTTDKKSWFIISLKPFSLNQFDIKHWFYYREGIHYDLQAEEIRLLSWDKSYGEVLLAGTTWNFTSDGSCSLIRQWTTHAQLRVQ